MYDYHLLLVQSQRRGPTQRTRSSSCFAQARGLVEAWHDRRIVAGDEVDDTIFSQLEAADIILLLVSSDFINSAYCYSREMVRAMERHGAGEARVMPIILRHCDWTRAPFGKLLAAPRDGKPVASWPDRDEALADVARQVRQAVEAISAAAAKSAKASSVSAGLIAIASNQPRSSNLRLKQEFTDKDADEFVRSSFDFICRFFDGSVQAIGERNPEITGTFDRIDSRRMAAILYRSGKTIAECSVRLDSLGRSNAIMFSYDSSASPGSYNEMLNPEAGDQSMHFKSMGMYLGSGHDKHLSQEGPPSFYGSCLSGKRVSERAVSGYSKRCALGRSFRTQSLVHCATHHHDPAAQIVGGPSTTTASRPRNL
ncbi:toll/interleukin-1 receptor domain-containing protein [Diaphorobacter aerolatus]|uniref:toll/interleukin-1 receptor domain-containing protein n=1 Tax=Diaphorobacter aerolatus TaxID=1288495 RepID=UPI001D0233DE|nr:toll/interleukin-1 receptor domain-containing protein [Diaphorobacter aerolatus]